jgi:HEAT repeat protein
MTRSNFCQQGISSALWRRLPILMLLLVAPRSIQAEVPVKFLFTELKSESAVLRASAATQLGKRGIRRSGKALLPLLADPDLTARLAAMRALGKIKYKPALPRLIKILDSSSDTERAHAAIAIGFFGKDGLVAGEALLRAAESDNHYLRGSALAAMANINKPQAPEAYENEAAHTIALQAAPPVH